MGEVLLLLRGRAGAAESVENGAPTVHLKAVVSRNMGQKLLADGAFQVDEGVTNHALQMEVVTAVPLPHVLVYVGRLGVTAVFSYSSLSAKLGKMAVEGAFFRLALPTGQNVQLTA